MSDPPENVENNNEKNLLSRFLLNEQCADDGLFLMNQEDREKIFNDMRALDVELGRNYRNVLRAEISKTIETEDIPPRLVYYLDDVPVEELIQFICIQKQDQWQWDVKNWNYCYKNLLKDVLYLYAKHGEMFVRALNQFLTPIYHDFIDDDPFTEDDSTTSFLDYYIGKRDEEEDPYNCEEFFSHCLDCLVGFETSNNCGYFLRVVAPWIAGAKTALDNSRADLYFYDRERMRMQQEQRLVKYKIEEKNGFFHLKRFDSKEERVLMEGCGVKNDDEKDQKQKSELEPDVKKSKQQIVASTTNEVASSFHRFTPFPSKGGFSHYQKRMENILKLK